MSVTFSHGRDRAVTTVKQALESMNRIDEYVDKGDTIIAVQNSGGMEIGNAAKLTIQLRSDENSTRVEYEVKKGNPIDITTNADEISSEFHKILQELKNDDLSAQSNWDKEVENIGATTIDDAVGKAKDRIRNIGFLNSNSGDGSTSSSDDNTNTANQGGLGEGSGKANDNNGQSFREKVKEAQQEGIEDQEGQPNMQIGSSVEPSEKTDHSPRELIDQAEGDIKLKHLENTSGRLTPWLTKPIVEYLKEDEQPEFIFADLSTDLEFEQPDGTSGEIGYATGAQFLVITDQRILYVNGAGGSGGMEDEILVREYDRIEKVGAEGGRLSDGIGFVDEDGVEFRFGVTGDTDLDDAIEYIDDMIENSPLDHADLDCSPQNELATRENISKIDDLMENGEKVHFLAKDAQGGVEIITGGRKETRDGWGKRGVWTAATDRRVVSSIPASLIGGSDEISISYDSMTSVDLEDMGAGVSDSNGILDTMQSFVEKRLVIQTNSRTYRIDVGKLSEEACREMANFIRKRSNERSHKPEEAEQSRSLSDPLDRIERLKQLNEQGAITDEEFEEKKSDLLDKV